MHWIKLFKMLICLYILWRSARSNLHFSPKKKTIQRGPRVADKTSILIKRLLPKNVAEQSYLEPVWSSISMTISYTKWKKKQISKWHLSRSSLIFGDSFSTWVCSTSNCCQPLSSTRGQNIQRVGNQRQRWRGFCGAGGKERESTDDDILDLDCLLGGGQRRLQVAWDG